MYPLDTMLAMQLSDAMEATLYDVSSALPCSLLWHRAFYSRTPTSKREACISIHKTFLDSFLT